jgi:hypothetical protein
MLRNLVRTTAVALVAIGLTAPAEAARVNLERLDRQAWECALWVRARWSGALVGSRFRYALVPKRDGTVSVASWGNDGETAAFYRCLRDKGNVMERVPEAALLRQEIAQDRAHCRGVGPGDMDWGGCVRAYGRQGVRPPPYDEKTPEQCREIGTANAWWQYCVDAYGRSSVRSSPY